jgi:hypothetical protein
MKIWKDRQGKAVTATEFASRWKEGVQKVTPLQQIKVQIWGYIIVLMGVIWGIVMAFLFKTWWLFTILTGSLLVSFTTLFGVIQKYMILSKIEKEVRINEESAKQDI